jgi:hypothetical protein
MLLRHLLAIQRQPTQTQQAIKKPLATGEIALDILGIDMPDGLFTGS